MAWSSQGQGRARACREGHGGLVVMYTQNTLTHPTRQTLKKRKRTDSRDSCDDLAELELVENGGLTGCIETNHQNAHLLLGKEARKHPAKNNTRATTPKTRGREENVRIQIISQLPGKHPRTEAHANLHTLDHM